MKYVVTDKGSFAIFSDTAGHKEVGHALYGTPVGAGFCTLEVGAKPNEKPDGDDYDVVVAHCFGESFSLDIVSRGEVDQNIINEKLNSHEL